jgi:5-(carboxyamino)imidazole ribonucleotide synthase
MDHQEMRAANATTTVGISPAAKDESGGRPPVVGMVGAGQLARMTAAAAIGLGIRFRVLAADPDESAAQVCADTVVGDYRSIEDLLAFAAGCDVVTFDHEHVPQPQLLALERAGFAVRPSASALRLTQDKLAMRSRLRELGVPAPRVEEVSSPADVQDIADRTDWPVVLKAVSGGYDGRGVWVCRSYAEVAGVLSHGVPVFAEEFVPFDRELAVLIARSPSGHGAAYPVVETVQRDGICHEVLAPAPGLADHVAEDIMQLGLKLARDLDLVGLLAVELFETGGGLMVNELAMRPHNSGHWTIEGARTSQFEQHLRAVLDYPLGTTTQTAPVVVMANVLGGPDDTKPRLDERVHHLMARWPDVKIHLYGKGFHPGRKVGHVTALGAEPDEVRSRARAAANYLSLGDRAEVDAHG